MNICCSGPLQEEKFDFEDFGVKVEEGYLKFDNNEGVFKYENTVEKEKKDDEKKKLKEELERLDKKKKLTERKLKELNSMIKNIENILLRNCKEQKYIEILVKETEEKRELIDNN